MCLFIQMYIFTKKSFSQDFSKIMLLYIINKIRSLSLHIYIYIYIHTHTHTHTHTLVIYICNCFTNC